MEIKSAFSKTFIGIVLVGFALAGWGFLVEPGLLVERDLKVDHWRGPRLRIAFFSDLHAGAPHIDEGYIHNLIERINAMKPDMVLIGGDLVINGVIGGMTATGFVRL